MIYLQNILPEWCYGVMAKSNSVLFIVGCVITVIAGYLLGSLNSAIIISKWKFKQDIRSFGSGNAGLTNMHRVYGKNGAVYTLIGDISKQIVSVLVGYVLLGYPGAYLAGAFCMLGHIFPVYYKFKGGKGVLTAATMILIIDPIIFLVLFVIFALVLLFTRYVSLSSVIAAICYPAAVSIAYGGQPFIFELSCALFMGATVIFMHRANLYRLFNNQEPKFSFRKKPKAEEAADTEDKENHSDTTFCPPSAEKKSKKKK